MNLTDEEIRIKVAEAMGWTNITAFHFEDVVTGKPKILHKGDCPTLEIEDQWLPNYPESLNACAEFEATLTDHDTMRMHHNITKILRQMKDPRPAWRSPAKVRCLAYLKTKGLIP
jgi:hypothetical protein